MQFVFDRTGVPVRFRGCREVLRVLDVVLPDWPRSEVEPGSSRPGLIIENAGGEFRLRTPWHSESNIEPTATSAVCSLVVDLVRAYASNNPDVVCLHAAAASFNGGLVIFPSEYRAGKSTLVAALAASHTPVFADDVMALNNDEGGTARSFGIAPRLRLPVPANLVPDVDDFFIKHRGPADRWYCYLQLPRDRIATYAMTAPVAAIVFLDRQPGASAEIQPIAKAESLKRLVRRSFGMVAPAEVALECMRHMVEMRPCMRLRYWCLSEAIELIRGVFGSGLAGMKTAFRSQETNSVDRRRVENAIDISINCDQFVQAPHVSLHKIDGEAFLADAQDNSIFNLNAIGTLIWECLHEPVTLGAVLATLQAIFPDVGRRRLRRDTESLLQELLENRLVRCGRR